MSATVRKVSLAIGREELEWAEKRAAREGMSVSAVITDATRRAREAEKRRKRQRKAWAEYEAWANEAGEPLTTEELEAAARELDGE
jgi:hypothetical protein